MAPRKVAHLTTVDASLRYLLLAQLDAVSAAGWEAVGISAPGPEVAGLEARGIRHRALASSTRSMSLWADLRAARELWAVLREERPDVLHTHNPKPGLYGRVLGRLAGVPRVVNTTHGLYAVPGDPILKQAAVYLLEWMASRFSHVELCQSPEDEAFMRTWRIVPRRKLRLLGNGVDLDRFQPGAMSLAERTRLRQSLGFDDDDIVVGCVSRLVSEKGVPELVAAVALLGPPFRLLHVGARDEAKADALGPGWVAEAEAAGVVLAGHRTDVDRLYHAMDVFCLPSHREGFPRAAMEAAACGLPVVATDIRGCRQVVDTGITGQLVPVRDPQALASAIGAYADAVCRSDHGRASRAKAEREFDEQVVVARVMASYPAEA